MPPKKRSKTKKVPEPKQKQKQNQKQVVNVTINNDKKSVKKKSKQSSNSSQNVKKTLIGNPTKDMVYRNAAFNRPINYNIVPELPLTGNQLITEMRQLMNAHTKEIEKTPLQMTEDTRKSMMKKADGIVKESKDAATSPVEQISEPPAPLNPTRFLSPSPSQTPPRMTTSQNDVSLSEYKSMFPEAPMPSLTLQGNLKKNTKAYKDYMARKNTTN